MSEQRTSSGGVNPDTRELLRLTKRREALRRKVRRFELKMLEMSDAHDLAKIDFDMAAEAVAVFEKGLE